MQPGIRPLPRFCCGLENLRWRKSRANDTVTTQPDASSEANARTATDSPVSASIYDPLPPGDNFRLLKVFPVDITISLADALKSFRLPKMKRVVWADALCIDQQDIKERNLQVKMMERVYAEAKGVLSWLGRDVDGIAKECFDLIIETNKCLDHIYLENKDIDDSVGELPSLPDAPPICREMQGWVHVESQALRVPFSVTTIGSNFVEIHRHYRTKISWRYQLPFIKELSYRRRRGLFLRVLSSSRWMSATDPRDRIYALLGCPLARNTEGEVLAKPNYDLSVEDVYFQTTCVLLQDKREAPWLPGFMTNNMENLLDIGVPSWSLSWNIRFKEHTISSPDFWFRAGGELQVFQPVINRTLRALQVPGRIFGKIAWLSDIINWSDLRLDWRDWANEIIEYGKPLIDIL
ncbi:hypothetical protein BU23DRAFT_603777 [Bimuria novae-zelandiae CBS 107.79]|uniref:Heterokaryon incompatibility domain-containing protein n=1 Tax=Bimuria novae-zelandiae CBS 107.79 TaxID=1447943 RepID=A0A6A5UT44_9PLEO|nr:hypothetical protein BU23DRAFT_603777 [Bimuria novae-zelandiae CBS 107.79]